MLGNVIQWSFITQQWSEIQADLVQHVELTFIAVAIGLCHLGPAGRGGLALPHHPGARWSASPACCTSSRRWPSSPSSAPTPATSPRTTTAEIALVGYTLLILMWNTLAGLGRRARRRPRSAGGPGLHAGSATLLRVELPLAAALHLRRDRAWPPSTVIGLVTVTALIGLGGLGQLMPATASTPPLLHPDHRRRWSSRSPWRPSCRPRLVVLERLVVPWSRIDAGPRSRRGPERAALPLPGPALVHRRGQLDGATGHPRALLAASSSSRSRWWSAPSLIGGGARALVLATPAAGRWWRSTRPTPSGPCPRLALLTLLAISPQHLDSSGAASWPRSSPWSCWPSRPS